MLGIDEERLLEPGRQKKAGKRICTLLDYTPFGAVVIFQ